MKNIWKDLFYQTGLNITSIAKETQVNRSSINQMVNGVRPITGDVYNYIQSLPITDELKNKFSALYIGKDFDRDFSELLFYFFDAASKYDSEILLPAQNEMNSAHLTKDSILNSGDFLSAISSVISASAKNNESVYTNLPVSLSGLTNTVRSICQNLSYKKLIHIIPRPEEIDFECIDILWYCLHMAEEGINTYAVSSNIIAQGLFPYCITNGDKAIIFDESLTVGYIVSDDIAELYADKMSELLKSAKPAGFFIDDDVQALTIENQYFSKSTDLPLFVLDSFLCTNKWTKEQIVEIAQDYLPENTKNVLAEQFVNYLKMMKPHNSYYTFDGVEKFAETGRVVQISGKYVKDANKKIRKAVLESFMNDRKVKFLKHNFIQLPECFGIDWTGSVFSFFTGRNFDPASHYSNRVCIPYNSINGFHEFMKYMIAWIDCCGIMDNEKKKYMLKNYIIQLSDD